MPILMIVAAVAPAVLLAYYINHHDKVEKEPFRLLLKLFIFGAIAAVPASFLEVLGMNALDALVPNSPMLHIFLEAFVVVALMEEACKLVFLRWLTWRNREFNFRFDGIVYAVCVSLGFAAIENVLYVWQYGSSVIMPRALLAIPGHMSFAVLMGLFYGQAKVAEAQGMPHRRSINSWLMLLVPTLFHGFYDYCLFLGSKPATMVFVVFVLLMYAFIIRTVRRQSASDVHISLADANYANTQTDKIPEEDYSKDYFNQK